MDAVLDTASLMGEHYLVQLSVVLMSHLAFLPAILCCWNTVGRAYNTHLVLFLDSFSHFLLRKLLRVTTYWSIFNFSINQNHHLLFISGTLAHSEFSLRSLITSNVPNLEAILPYILYPELGRQHREEDCTREGAGGTSVIVCAGGASLNYCSGFKVLHRTIKTALDS